MWRTGTIDELCEIEYGTRVVRKNEHGTIYPVYGGGGETFRVDRMNRSNRVIVSRFGMSEKCTRFVEGDFFLNDSGLTVSPKMDDLSQSYLDRVIVSLNNKIYTLGRGTAQKNLDMSAFKCLEISYPPFQEQQRIVVKLDAAFAEIDKAIKIAQDAIDNAIRLREKTFKALFSDVGEKFGVTLLGDGIKLISGQHIAAKDYNSDGHGIGYLTGPSDFGDMNPVVTKFTTCPKKKARKGDVLVTIKGSGIGKANIMIEQELAISRQLAAIRPVSFTSEFVFAFIKTQFQKLQSLGNGAAIPGLSRGDIEQLEIPSPPIEIQGKILEQARSSDNLIEQYRECQIEKIENLYRLKSAILAEELQPPQSDAA